MSCLVTFVFLNEPPTPDLYTLSLHDALPISEDLAARGAGHRNLAAHHLLGVNPHRGGHHQRVGFLVPADAEDRKSTRLNSSHRCISYAVFCLKKKIK